MTVLDRYLLVRLGSALIKAVVSFLFLFVFIDLLTERRGDILQYDVPWHAVLRYYAAMMPQVVYQVAPLGVLVSGLLVLGDAAQNNEVTAALAGGISLRRFVRTPLVAALVFSIAVFIMEESIGAQAGRQAAAIDENYFARSDSGSLRTGVSWASLRGGWTCHILKFNRLALTGENVLLNSIRRDAVEQIIARRIYWDEQRRQWMIEDGRWLIFDPDVEGVEAEVRITQLPAPITESPGELFAMDRPPKTKTAGQLAREVRRAADRGIDVQGLLVDYHAKFSQPALSFVMIWLAVPFALRIRRGGVAISFGASIAIALAYLILFGIGVTLGDVGRLPPVLAAWLANIVFLTIGVVLFLRTPT